MRFCALELPRYGCFTDAGFPLPGGDRDLHIIYGPNEAGKSTVLNAVEDLLFGFPQSSPFDFRHDYKALRVGGTVEGEAAELRFRRRKGKSKTILDLDERPLRDSILEPFLNGIDRPFFQRMFSLDHVRLREGGAAILKEEGELGKVLFAAGAGMSGLPAELKRLEEEADGLWGERKKSGRRYSDAEEDYREAGQRLNEATVLARAWKAAQDELSAAEQEHAQAAINFAAIEAERRKLERMRRLLPYLANHHRLAAEVSELGSVPELPADAAESFREAELSYNRSRVRMEALQKDVASIRVSIDEITLDTRLLERVDEIAELYERRAVIEDRRHDLPRRKAEVATHTKSLRRLLADVGWQDTPLDDVEARLPARPLLERIRGLIERKAQIAERELASRRVVEESERKLEALEEKLAERNGAEPKAELAAAIKEAHRAGDLEAQIAEATRKRDRAKRQLDSAVAALAPWSVPLDGLEVLVVPDEARIEEQARLLDDLRDQRKALERKLSELQAEIQDTELRRQQMVRDDRAVSGEELDVSRQRRDRRWSLIRAKFLESQPVATEELAELGADPAAGYEKSVAEADGLSDQRFAGAEASARLLEIDQKLERLGSTIASQKQDFVHLENQETALGREWAALWRTSDLDPAEPRVMLSWLERRGKARAALEEMREAAGSLEALRRREEHLRSRLADVLSLETKVAPDQLLVVLIGEAETEHEHLTKALASQDLLVRRIEDEAAALLSRRQDHERAVEDGGSWGEEWKEAITGAGLPEDAALDVVRASLKIFEDIRGLTAKIADLRESRIATMERDVEEFTRQVDAMIADRAPDLANEDPVEAAIALKSRTDEELRKRERQEELARRFASQKAELREAEQERGLAAATIKPLMDAAGVSDWNALREQIARADLVRARFAQLEEIRATLLREGDGKSIDELEEECREADPDQTKIRIESLSAETESLNHRLQELATRKRGAEDAVRAISGSADAAVAEADRQQALARMTDAAERYIRLKCSAILLRYGIDRFRQEKQAPLLARAGELLRTLTVGRFEKLTVRYDEKDQPMVAGIRPDGELVGVGGMSDGTVDQLYLALRVASMEDYLTRGFTMPFVADDLFINFDDERAAAGIRVLAELARRTQVLFFTHHEHLLEIARRALEPDEPNIVML